MASYVATLAIGRYDITRSTTKNGLPVYVAVDPTQAEASKKVLGGIPGIMDWAEYNFGPYPFSSTGAIVDRGEDAGYALETQTRPVFPGAPDTATLVHELAHQWFGDSVTPTTWTDLWLNEGFATYAQDLYTQDVFNLSEASLDRYTREADAKLRKKLGPPGKPNPKNFAEGNVYLCPEAMLREIHNLIGDKKFFALATAWVQQQKNTQQDRASFIAFVNKQTGRDLTKLINTWLDSKTTPKSIVN